MPLAILSGRPAADVFLTSDQGKPVGDRDELVARFAGEGLDAVALLPTGRPPELIETDGEATMLEAVRKVLHRLRVEEGVPPWQIAVLTGARLEESAVWRRRQFGNEVASRTPEAEERKPAATMIAKNNTYPTAMVVVLKLTGNFDVAEALKHASVDAEMNKSFTKLNSSNDTFNGFPSAMIEGSYDANGRRLHTYNRVVIPVTLGNIVGGSVLVAGATPAEKIRERNAAATTPATSWANTSDLCRAS
mgnify:CR=1 FL=1